MAACFRVSVECDERVWSRDDADVSSGSDDLENRTGKVDDLFCPILVRMRGRAASRRILASPLR